MIIYSNGVHIPVSSFYGAKIKSSSEGSVVEVRTDSGTIKLPAMNPSDAERFKLKLEDEWQCECERKEAERRRT
jgi:hypothetical protein